MRNVTLGDLRKIDASKVGDKDMQKSLVMNQTMAAPDSFKLAITDAMARLLTTEQKPTPKPQP